MGATEESLYPGRPHRVLFDSNPLFSLILLSPEGNGGRRRKGIKFWMERLIINSAGELGFRGRLGFNLSKAPSPTTIALRVRSLTYEFGGGHKPSVHDINHLNSVWPGGKR